MDGKKHVRKINVCPSCFIPEFNMEVFIPDDLNDEEYIDMLFESILNKDITYNIEWNFI